MKHNINNNHPLTIQMLPILAQILVQKRSLKCHTGHISLSLSLSLSQAQKLKHIHSCFGLKNCFKVRVVVGVCVAASVVEGLPTQVNLEVKKSIFRLWMNFEGVGVVVAATIVNVVAVLFDVVQVGKRPCGQLDWKYLQSNMCLLGTYATVSDFYVKVNKVIFSPWERNQRTRERHSYKLFNTKSLLFLEKQNIMFFLVW